MKRLLRPVQQDVVPMRRIEILDGFEFRSGSVDLPLQSGQFLVSPQLAGVSGQAPTGIIAHWLIARLIAARRPEVIHQVRHDVRTAALFGEAVMLFVQLMAIEGEAKVHKGDPVRGYCKIIASVRTQYSLPHPPAALPPSRTLPQASKDRRQPRRHHPVPQICRVGCEPESAACAPGRHPSPAGTYQSLSNRVRWR